MKALRIQLALTWLVIAVLVMGAFRQQPPQEITVRRINVVDSAGNTRVILAGGFPPRRAAQAGLIFVHPSGVEAGGLIYTGEKRDGVVDAGAVLTFDKYGDDQVTALSYRERNGQRTQGLTFQDRPDSLGTEILSYYRRIDPMPPGPARDSLVAEMLRTVPAEQLAARRMFLGRSANRSSQVALSDPRGRVRLRLEVDSLGSASIVFLDENGAVVKTVKP